MSQGNPEDPWRMLLDAVQGKVFKPAMQKTIERDLQMDLVTDEDG